MKFRVAKDAKTNAGKLVESSNVYQYENGRVEVTGRIGSRIAAWSGTYGTGVIAADADAEAWLLTLPIDWKKHSAWMDVAQKIKAEEEARQREDHDRRLARAREENAIIQAAQQKFAVAVREGVMQFDGVPQIASVPGEDGRKWVQAWVLVEVPS